MDPKNLNTFLSAMETWAGKKMSADDAEALVFTFVAEPESLKALLNLVQARKSEEQRFMADAEF